MNARPTLTSIGIGFGIVLRIVTAAMMVLAAVFVGWLVGGYVAANFPRAEDHKALATFLGAGFFLASLERVTGQLPGLGRWVRTGDFSGLYSFSSFAFTLFVSLSAAVLSAAGTPGEVVPDPRPAYIGGAPAFATSNSVVFVTADARRDIVSVKDSFFIIPFYDEAGGCSVADPDYAKGKTLHPDTSKFIDELAAGLLGCTAPDKPVKLVVRGFASTQPFRGCAKDVSDRLNQQIANDRAAAVSAAFADAVRKAKQNHPQRGGNIEVTVVNWTNVDDMYAQLGFNDRDAGTYSSERAVLTRRAEVIVADAGDCRVRGPVPLTAASPAPANAASAPSAEAPTAG